MSQSINNQFGQSSLNDFPLNNFFHNDFLWKTAQRGTGKLIEIPENRCRLILSLPIVEVGAELLDHVLAAADVACVLIGPGGLDEQTFLNRCKTLIPIIQKHDVAAIIVGDTRIAGRADADGILIENGLEALKDATARFSPQKMVGCGGIRERHKALEAGECDPDFMFFGNLDRDIRPEPHRKNLAMANWWAELVEIPCAVMGGNSLQSAVDVALSGAEFVVLNKAVFEYSGGPVEGVCKVNELLEEFGPKFDEE